MKVAKSYELHTDERRSNPSMIHILMLLPNDVKIVVLLFKPLPHKGRCAVLPP